jgi:hypothetical protein
VTGILSGALKRKSKHRTFAPGVIHGQCLTVKSIGKRAREAISIKIGDRVVTKEGPGVIKFITHPCDKYPCYGVLHDEFPEGFSHQFKDDILGYRRDELVLESEVRR